MLINTNDVPDTIPTINSEPVNILCTGVELVVGGPPSDDAGCPVGGASIYFHIFLFWFVFRFLHKFPSVCDVTHFISLTILFLSFNLIHGMLSIEHCV